MVVDHPSHINDALEMPIPLMVVELKLQGFHTSDDSTIRFVNQNYRHKTTSVTLINYHFVWITRRRRNVLLGEVESRLKQRINEVATELDCGVIAMEIMPEHVHLFLNCPPTLAPDQIMFRIKARSARSLNIFRECNLCGLAVISVRLLAMCRVQQFRDILQSRSLSDTLPAPAGAGTALYPTTKASGLYPVPQPSLCCKELGVLSCLLSFANNE
jgi:REP element-mobilizing transposase RayT